jgi:hypothetical protein
MKLIEIYEWVIIATCSIVGAILILVACGGSKRKYEKFTPEELKKLDEFRAQRREPPKP